MNEVKQLKPLLQKIKSNNWSVPTDVNLDQLTTAMMKHLGSTDSELRDELIFSLFQELIRGKNLSDHQLKALLKLSLSDQHLFYNVGAKEDDTVFNRAFAILVVSSVVMYHNQNGENLLTEEEILHVHKNVLCYARLENDVRGFVENKGWAHSTAHLADALNELAVCKVMQKIQLVDMLEAVKEKVCFKDYTYINEEDERLITAVTSIIERNILSDEDITTWIKQFDNIEQIKNTQQQHCLLVNRKNFLRSLYFRFKQNEVCQPFTTPIETVLNNICFVY
ncbi:DUF2785 domain-containing protein [Cytobacillus sp. IB215665]|uniref:DUF2785 domain-containing protein n=1 Tax=Cytobacillus sp. IB215665 TaxID=3097357 RepID=UPI002A1136C8|nr:DUF2785 domain-containing protein [Cytobacillus sp. IB215665]MDX8366331.1 DUF2785 domain-containing protein [Cytobacillus sp. IB215665]